MGEFLGKIAEGILELFRKNHKRPKLWITIIGLCLIFILLIPYIDANFFYYSRMERRITILDQVIKLDPQMIESNDVFTQEYEAILNEISQNDERSINSVMNKMINFFTDIYKVKGVSGNGLIKFFTGALWLIILLICVPLMDTFKKKSDKIMAFFLVLILAIIIGFICMNIPIIITPMVNYISIPLLQLVGVIIFVIKSKKGSKTSGQLVKKLS